MKTAKKPRIAILGFALESNRSAPVSDRKAFLESLYLDAGAISHALSSDQTLLPPTVQGFCDEMDRRLEWTPAPILLAEAPPGGPVEQSFFDEILQKIHDGLMACKPLDGVYLSEHGAGLSTNEDDADGAVFSTVREAVGRDIPIIATLDLHGHVTPRMQSSVDIIVAYLTNPHVDQFERGTEAARLLHQMLGGLKTRSALVKVPMISPAVSLLTKSGPFADLVEYGQKLLKPPVLNVSILPGFAPANSSTNGMSVVVTTDASVSQSEGIAQKVAKEIATKAWADRHRYKAELTSLDEAVNLCRLATQHRGQPGIILADVADNPGAGGRGNTMYIVRKLIEKGIRDVTVGMIIDPDIAKEAHLKGVGAEFQGTFNLNETTRFSERFEAHIKVKRLASGTCVGRRGLFKGRRIDLGLCALLEIDCINLVVATARHQLAEPVFLERLGLNLADLKVLVVKSRGHFRAGFDEHHTPEQIFEVDAPGLTTPVIEKLGLNRVSRPIFPLDPDMFWQPES